MNPLVSIVMPARNAAAGVGRAVRSILAQDFSAWELIVLDDGSSDDTVAVLRATVDRDPRVRLIALGEPRGLVPALEVGLAAARGRFIARMDADDEMMPERLSAQVKLLENRPAIGVASSLVEFGGDAVAAHGYALHVEWINTLREPEEIAVNRFVESPVAHPSVMFRRELVERHGGYRDSGEPEDYELWLRWMEAGVRFAKVPRTLLTWHDSPGRLSRTDARYAVEAFYACKCRYLVRALPRDRPIWLWGAGRVTRQRFAPLERAGVRFAGFVDVDAKKINGVINGRAVVGPGAIPRAAFVIVGVGTRGARDLIRATLERDVRRAGGDFILAA